MTFRCTVRYRSLTIASQDELVAVLKAVGLIPVEKEPRTVVDPDGNNAVVGEWVIITQDSWLTLLAAVSLVRRVMTPIRISIEFPSRQEEPTVCLPPLNTRLT